MNRATGILILILGSCFLLTCVQEKSSHQKMIEILAGIKSKVFVKSNFFSPEARWKYLDSIIKSPGISESGMRMTKFQATAILLQLGRETEAITILEDFLKDSIHLNALTLKNTKTYLALAYLRLGERTNCIYDHASESCILPIQGLGVHIDPTASAKARILYQSVIDQYPDDLESKWLLNIIYMTLGQYPKNVPSRFLIPGLDVKDSIAVQPFRDIAPDLGLDIRNMSGGTIVDDFNNDGYLDIFTSGWGLDEELHYFVNNRNGTFSDRSAETGLHGITGGLNITQADYNNDGLLDVLVLRGAWKAEFGNEPNSLIKNNGDGTFTDVTIESGLLSFHPTQTATWNDFNNDGWLDLYIGNESLMAGTQQKHPCELYINNKNGTFTDKARHTKTDMIRFVKGVTSGDYDHDGWKDIFLSTQDGQRILMRNKGGEGDTLWFEDVTHVAGLDHEYSKTFPTWFWDYDNDGWLDIFACDYTYEKSLAYYAGAEQLKIPAGNPDKMLLYHNNGDGSFRNTALESGLTKNVFAMGSNFGDIDNDGFLDMYLGTGNPLYQSIIPNKMFKNINGQKFADVTSSARVGHLQKGHGVSFADLDNDGDQDIYEDMGGAFIGDAYQNSLYLNDGQYGNHWICLVLEGTQSNKFAVGSQVKITFHENGVLRKVYRDVNSGGSFGSSPLRREIGLGKATLIDEIEIYWHGGSGVQLFKNIPVDQFIKIKEGKKEIEKINLKKLDWTIKETLCPPVAY